MPTQLRRILAALLVVAIVEPTVALANDPPAAPAPTTGEPAPAPAAAPDAPVPEPTAPDAPAPEPAPPAIPTIAVRGTLTDAATQEGLPAATIQFTDATGALQTIVTELDGTYVLQLVAGTYELTFSTPEYDDVTRTIIVAATPLEVTLALAPTTRAAAEETIEISSTIDTRKESAVLAVRRAAVTVSDALSSQEISRTPDSNAGDAMKRVVAVTVTDGKYVALRGLEGRYVTSLLNGVLLPSPEPDRNAVPLDLFPTSLLSTMTVYKSYSAELPGQFGGGALQIETTSFPPSFELKFGVSTSANTAATGQDGLTNATATGARGFLGFDDGRRKLPTIIPRDRAVRNSSMDPAQLEAIGEAMPNVWTPDGETVTPNVSVTATLGDTRKIAGKRVGYLMSGLVRRQFTVREGRNSRTALVQGTLTPIEDLEYRVGEAEGTVGALLNAGVELSPGNDLTVLGLYSHVGEDTNTASSGYSEPDASNIDVSRMSFVTRSLGFAQLQGKHRLSRARGMELTWQGNVATTSRNELDSRDLVYTVDASTGMRNYKDQPGSGQHFWQELNDLSGGGGADLTLRAGPVRLRAGTMIQASSRELGGRRFRYRYVGADTSVRQLAGEQMFSDSHIGPAFQIEEGTLEEDAYTASLATYAGYAMAEVELATKWRAIAGLRVEHARQQLANGSRYAIAGLEGSVARTDSDPLPTANLVYAATPNVNLRAAYSYTLVRPRFRELAPFLFFDYIRRRNISGNPDLVTTRLHNADVRAEWFPSEDEVFAASAFYKRFVDPIEQVLANANSDATFRNADGGDVYGLELEARTTLARLSPVLAKFRVGSNVSLMRSRVELGDALMILTSKSRPLYGQSPFVINANLGWADPKIVDVNLLYNVTGRRIADVGIDGLPDTYEAPVHRVDVVAARAIGKDLKLKISASNLLNQQVRLEQGDLTINSFRPGVSFSLGLDWTP